MALTDDYGYAEDAPMESTNTFNLEDVGNGWGQQSYDPNSFMGQYFNSDSGWGQQSFAPSDYSQMEYQPQEQSPIPPDTSWGSQSFQPGSAMFNLMQQSVPSNGMTTPNAVLPDNQGGTSGALGGIQNVLANIFNNKGAMTGLGAVLEGMQNKKKQSAYTQLAQQMQPAMDPFGSQRGFYQQQLQQAVQDPYSAPIVRDQVAQLQKAQAIKDAQAGRRSNQATSSPALLAAQAQVAQKYMDSLQTPAGANINPSGLNGILQLLQQGQNAGINGFASPMMSAAGYNSGTTNNQAQLDAIKKLLSGG